MAKDDIPCSTISVLQIKCSFCSNEIREDVSREVEYNSYSNQEYHFSNRAKAKGFRSGKTKNGIELIFCEDHRRQGIDLGVIYE